MGISKIRWSGHGQFTHEDHTYYYSGCNNDRHELGVGIIVDKKLSQRVTSFISINEILLLELELSSVNLVLS